MRLPDRTRYRSAKPGAPGRARSERTQKGPCVSLDDQILLHNTWLPLFSPAPQYNPEGGGGNLATKFQNSVEDQEERWPRVSAA